MSNENEAQVAAEPKGAQTESVLGAREAHLFDIYNALGIRWGDNPFARIAALLADEKAKEADSSS